MGDKPIPDKSVIRSALIAGGDAWDIILGHRSGIAGALNEVDFSNVELRRQNLSEINFARADFYKANLQSANLKKSVLSNAEMSLANLPLYFGRRLVNCHRNST